MTQQDFDVNAMYHTKEVRITDLLLETDIGEITLKNIFLDIQIYEDIYSSTMTCELSISDSRNLPEFADLRGGEKLTIKYRTAGYEEDTILEFFLNKISERIITKDKHAIYNMSFVSKEKIYDSFNKISRSYTNDSLNFYIQDILTNADYGCGSQKQIYISEESIYTHHIVLPYQSPLSAINFLKRRCVSPIFTGSPYLFFENKKGFVLSSIENLMTQQTVQEYIYSPKIEYENRDINNDFRKVESYLVKNSLNFIERLQGAGESSSLFVFDFVTKKFMEYDYIYENNNTRNLTQSQKNSIVNSFVFDNQNLKEKFNSSRTFAFKSSETDDRNNYVEVWAQARESSFTNLNSICLELTCPGDSQLNVGEMINFYAPSYAAGDIVEDEVISGKYLITGIAHTITKRDYTMKLEICKDSFFRQLSGQGKEI